MAYGLNSLSSPIMQNDPMNPAVLTGNMSMRPQYPSLAGCSSGRCGTSGSSMTNQPKSASFFRGAPAQMLQNQLFNPEQQAAMSDILKYALSNYKNPEAGFEPFAQSARQNLFEQTLPSIAERFNLMGKGAATSGAFQGMLSRAGSDLESQLAQGAANYGLQRQGLLSNLLGIGLGRQFENVYKPREASGIESLIPGAVQAAAKVLPFLFF